MDDAIARFALDWMDARLAEVSLEVAEMMKDFRLSEALKTIYSLIWNDFCSWYLEWVKPGIEQPISKHVYDRTVSIYEDLLQLLHPFLPFVTEEIYHLLKDRVAGDDLIAKQLRVVATPSPQILREGVLLQELITAVRDARNKIQLKPKETIRLWINTSSQGLYERTGDILRRQINAENLGFTEVPKDNCISIVVQTDKLYMEANVAAVDMSGQKEQMQKDLDYLKGFLISVEKKLGNERFVQNAKPEVIDAERKKQSDALAKIQTLEESLKSIG
jgi:valyl-tRNA synthetase